MVDPTEAKGDRFRFLLSVDGGRTRTFNSRHSEYALAVMEAFGRLALSYPCTVTIWVPRLVKAGYGPYHYRVDDFVDVRGNRYVCPSVMSNAQPPATALRTLKAPDHA
jgi:hypothetical protein